MKIYCIVVYTSASAKQEFHAPLSGGWLATEPHLRTIQNYISTVFSMIKGRDGIHTLATHDQIYYAHLAGDRLSLVAADEAFSPDRQRNLFLKIAQATHTQDLDKLINDPEEAVKSKIDVIQESLEETRQIILDDIEKLLARDDSLKDLLIKTDELSAVSFKFSKRSTDLKNQTRCPGLFSFFSSIRNLFGAESYQYDYEPSVQSKL